MRISDWSSDVCSSDLLLASFSAGPAGSTGLTGSAGTSFMAQSSLTATRLVERADGILSSKYGSDCGPFSRSRKALGPAPPLTAAYQPPRCSQRSSRSEEHTSELQSLMRISYAVFCLKKKTEKKKTKTISRQICNTQKKQQRQ